MTSSRGPELKTWVLIALALGALVLVGVTALAVISLTVGIDAPEFQDVRTAAIAALAVPVLAALLAGGFAAYDLVSSARTFRRAAAALTRLADGEVPAPLPVEGTTDTRSVASSVNRLSEAIADRERLRVRERHEFAHTLELLASALFRMQDASALHALTARECVRILEVPSASVFVPDGDDGFWCVAVAGESGGRSVGDVVRRSDGDPIAAAADERSLQRGERRGPDGRAVVVTAVPIEVGGQLDAVVALDSDPDRHLGADDFPVVKVLAWQVAVALTNIRSHEEAALERERYRSVVENAGDGIVVRRGDRVAFANRAAQEMLGRFEVPLKVHEFFSRFVFADDLHIIEGKYRDRLAGEESRQHYEVRLRRPDGSPFPVLMDSSPISYEGESCSLIFMRDLTDLKRAEEALRDRNAQLVQAEKLAAVGSLAAGVAHEINNPLAYMRGSLEILHLDMPRLRELLPEGEQGFVDTLEDSVAANLDGIQRIATIVRSLRQFSKPAHDRREVELNAVVETAFLFATSRFRERRVRGVQDFGRDLPKIVASETQIGQVVLNLLMNAADAMPEDGGTVTVRTRHDEESVTVEVQDDGPGIPEAVRSRIFTAFFTTKETGTGLGLSISRHIAIEHGGDLTFESEAGRGATFRLRLPLPDHQLATTPLDGPDGPAIPHEDV